MMDLTITAIETEQVRVPLARTYKGSHYKMTHRSTIITRVHTASGLVGEAYAGDEDAGLAEIDGTFDGVIKAQSVNVTSHGIINGTTEAKHIRVEGQVNQTLKAEGTLLIESSGRVSGDVSYADLEIRRGGDIQGSITIIK